MSQGIRPDWAEALDLNVTEWSSDAFKSYTGLYNQYTKTISSTRDRELYEGNSGFSNPKLTAEQGDVGTDEKIKRYEVTIINDKFTDSHAVSREMQDDVKFPVNGSRDAAMFGKSFARFIDKSMAGVLRNAFSTAKPVYGAKQLISTIHPTNKAGGDTRSNAIIVDSVMPAFSPDAVSAAEQILMEQTDDQGEIIDYSGERRLLVVTQKYAEDAWQLAQTDKVPDTAENANNYFKRGVNMDVLVLPYLGAKQAVLNGDLAGSDEYWFYMVPGAPYGIIHQAREGFTTEAWYEHSNQTHYTSGTIRFGKGVDGFEFIVGSNGSGSAFTD